MAFMMMPIGTRVKARLRALWYRLTWATRFAVLDAGALLRAWQRPDSFRYRYDRRLLENGPEIRGG